MAKLSLHGLRLEAVYRALAARDATTLLDLGCGPGPLMISLIQSAQFDGIVGVDISARALSKLRQKLEQIDAGRCQIRLLQASVIDATIDLSGFDAAILVETIEHIPPDRLSGVEGVVFGRWRPRTVIVTTPNSECNGSLGVPRYRLRHSDHKFEWGRQKFMSWAMGVAARNRYDVQFQDVGKLDYHSGGVTQMAQFFAQNEQS